MKYYLEGVGSGVLSFPGDPTIYNQKVKIKPMLRNTYSLIPYVDTEIKVKNRENVIKEFNKYINDLLDSVDRLNKYSETYMVDEYVLTMNITKGLTPNGFDSFQRTRDRLEEEWQKDLIKQQDENHA